MSRRRMPVRPFVATWLAVLLAGAIAVPAKAAEPTPSQGTDPASEAGTYFFEDGVYRTPPGVSFAPDRLLVKFRPRTTLKDQAGALQSVDAAVDTTSRLVPGLQVLTIHGGGDVIAAVAELSRRSDVEYAMPDFEYQLTLEPDDPDYSGQWALPIIGAPAAWARSTGSTTVTVAVLDTGVDLDHPDLVANLVPGWNFVADNDNPTDDHGHGTHVAGIIGAVGNNATGVSGVNWSVNLMPLKICDQYGSCSLSAEIAALEFAVTHGARVANASFGAANGGWAPEQDAIEAAGDAGLVYVAGAGNNHTNNDANQFYPAGYPLDNIIAVGASTPSDEMASFSNYGLSSVDLLAPGDGILSTIPDGYGVLSGTSMAAPMVAGAAALVKSLHPNWTPQRVRRQLINTATPISGLAGKVGSCGRLNLDAATNPATVLKPALCVTRRGSGIGNVNSTTGSIDCGVTCAAFFSANATVTLTAVASPGSSFGGWSGACSGTGSCAVTLSSTTAVGAVFVDPASQGGWSSALLAPPAGRDPLLPGSGSDRWESFYNVSLSANGKVRAKTTFNLPTGWCYYASTDTGGVFMERKTATGWKADGVLTAPAFGPEPSDYWANCASFGTVTRLSANGSTLVVTADVASDYPTGYRCAAFVYRRSAGGWRLDGNLYPAGADAQGAPDLTTCGLFGLDAAISNTGDRVAIYAPHPYNEGWRPRVDVFARGTSGWAREKTILAPTAAGCGGGTGDHRLAMSGDGATILVGDPYCNAGIGRVYHYRRTGSSWTKQPIVTNPDPSSGRVFGESVAMSANGLTAAIGVTYQPGQPDVLSTSWLFELSAGTWTKRTRLEPGVADPDATFACTALVRAGQRIVCASYETRGFNTAQGSIYVFNRPAAGWSAGSTRTRIFAPFGYAFDWIGAGGRFWYPDPAVREDGKLIDATITPMSLAVGGYRDRIGYEFRR